MEIKNYIEKLNSFDYTYEMSDDHGVWGKGNLELGLLKAYKDKTEEHTKAFNAFEAFWNGEIERPLELL